MEKKDKNIDWILLVFLVLFVNQAMFTVKVLGLILVYVIRPNFSFGLMKGRMPKFIPLLLLLATFNLLFFVRDFSKEYLAAFAMGNILWVFSFLGFHQIKLSVEKYTKATLHRTLKLYVVVHFLFCVGQLVKIMLITGKLNPYVGLEFPYGMSTGDNVFGLLMENSIYNVTISTLLAIYFIFQRNILHALLAAFCAIIVFSNFGTIVFSGILAGLFFVGVLKSITNEKYQWINRISPPGHFYLYIPVFYVLIVTIYLNVSPENTQYFVDKVKAKIFSIDVSAKDNYRTITADQKLEAGAFDLDRTDYNLQRLKEYNKDRNKAFSVAVRESELAAGKTRMQIMREMTSSYVQKLQGKTLAVLETKQYLLSSKIKLLFGSGTTRFSSHIAQKMAGFDSSRLFMNVLPHFVATEYKENHMLLIEERIKSTEEYFSTANFPDSFYNQIFGEYGILGALLFLVFYVGYFAKYISRWTYGIWLFMVLLPFAHLSYIFDTLCVMPFFEWLMLLDIEKE